jgi:hypothetical protein
MERLSGSSKILGQLVLIGNTSGTSTALTEKDNR